MLDYFVFWIAKSFSEIVFSVFLIFLAVIIYCIVCFCAYIKKAFCKHEKVMENRSCDAICVSCRKNLGFIGTYRKNKCLK